MSDTKETKSKSLDIKAVLSGHAEKGTKIKYGERKEVEIISATRHYKKGQVIRPHLIMADALISAGIAKEVK